MDRGRTDAAALRWLTDGMLSLEDLAELMEVDRDRIERCWRGEEPLGQRERELLASLLDRCGTQVAWLAILLREPVPRLEPED
ncbi:MAG: hypothetical protein ACREM1_14845 [Longimicrobiales bacterium]